MTSGVTDSLEAGLACERCAVPVHDGTAIVQRLRTEGHQVTLARLAVIRAVATQGRPFTAGDLCEAVASTSPTVGRATVFRTLELLVEAGVLHRLHALRGDASYVMRDPARTNDAHLYLICTACDGVTEIRDAALPALLASVAAREAFRAESGLLEIVGRCQSC